MLSIYFGFSGGTAVLALLAAFAVGFAAWRISK